MQLTYRHDLFRQLRDQLVDSATAEQRHSQASRAARLLGELDNARVYPYSYYHIRITQARSALGSDVRISAEDARHDIRQLVEDLTTSESVASDCAPERVLTVDELSRMFNVSTKTISRWRRDGLVGRRFLIEGRMRLGFLESSVDRFVKANAGRVRRGSRFRHLTDQERQAIIEHARRLAQAGDSPTEVMKETSRRVKRSVETVRYTIRSFDRANPDRAVFGMPTGAMSPATRERIYRQYRRGASIESLARRYHRKKDYVSKLVRSMRLQRVMQLPLAYMPSPEFLQEGAADDILGPLPQPKRQPRRTRRPTGVPSYLASLYEVPLLTREQEVHLFRKLNFLKFRASALRDRLNPERPQSRLMDEIETIFREAVSTKNDIIQANLRLVVSIAKRYVGQHDNFFDLISDGNVSLMRAVEKFDYTLGNKFSTYASWAIKKNYARTFVGQLRYHDRFRTSQEELLDSKPESRPDPYMQESAQLQREADVRSILRCLTERERRIVASRFGLAPGEEPKTLKEVGTELGVSKERVRQIESRAINKLREAAEIEHIESPAA